MDHPHNHMVTIPVFDIYDGGNVLWSHDDLQSSYSASNKQNQICLRSQICLAIVWSLKCDENGYKIESKQVMTPFLTVVTYNGNSSHSCDHMSITICRAFSSPKNLPRNMKGKWENCLFIFCWGKKQLTKIKSTKSFFCRLKETILGPIKMD